MIRRILTITMTAVLLFSFSACSWFGAEEEPVNTIEINPMAEAANKDTVTVNLYFGSGSDFLLIGETRNVEAPVNERIETAVVGELIKGPSSSRGEFTQLINPNTSVSSVTDNGECLFVTLSKEFLEPMEAPTAEQSASETYQEEQNQKRQLAVYSIVNTLIELSGFPRVQVLIDQDESGNGTRISRQEAGFEGEGALEPLSRNGDIILTPENTIRTMFDAIERREWSKVYSYLCYSDLYDTQKPSETDFTTQATTQSPMIEGYTITDSIVSQTGVDAVVMVDYDIRIREGETQSRTNIPILMVRENDIWKIRYSTFSELFLDL